MKKIKFIKNIVYYLVIILLVLVCLITAASFFEIPGGFHLFMVESGSMEPSIKTASIIFTKKVDEYSIGDTIAFNTSSSQSLKLSSTVVTHRIFEFKDSPERGRLIVTKGDANDTPDPEPIKKEQIVGKVVFSLPYLGHPVRFAKTQVGFIALIVIPGTLIIYGEIINIKNEITKFIKKRRRKIEKNESEDSKKTKKEKVKIKKKGKKKMKVKLLKTPLVLLILSFSFFNYFLPTKAYYNDTSTSKDNIISAGVWESYPEIKSGDIVINEVYYDVDSAHGDDGNVSTSDEWIELYNNLDRDVSLLNWTITDNTITRTITADKKIPAKGFAVIALDTQTWSYWPLIPASAEKIELGVTIGGGLANAGDRVILRNDKNVEIDAVSWGTDTYAFTPSVADVVDGHSISRIVKGVDTNTSLDWMDTFAGSTPAGPNPGTNPHNPDGSLYVKMSTPDLFDPLAPISLMSIPEPTSTIEPTYTPEPTTENTSTPMSTPTTEPTPTIEPTASSEPTPTPGSSGTPEPTTETMSTSTSTQTSEPTPTVEPTVIPTSGGETATPSPLSSPTESTPQGSTESSPTPLPLIITEETVIEPN